MVKFRAGAQEFRVGCVRPIFLSLRDRFAKPCACVVMVFPPVGSVFLWPILEEFRLFCSWILFVARPWGCIWMVVVP